MSHSSQVIGHPPTAIDVINVLSLYAGHALKLCKNFFSYFCAFFI